MKTKNKDWYIETFKAIQSVFKEDCNLFCDLLASTSPRKSVRGNFKLAVEIYIQYKNGYDLDFNGLGVIPSIIPNIKRALNRVELSGNKVKAFAKNLKGNLEAVTIDMWILRYFKLENTILTNKRYRDLVKKIKTNARRYKLKPAEYQAVIWEKVRSRYGFKPVNFKSVMQEHFNYI